MATFYLDTSALLKRYAAERGTAWMVGLTTPMAGHRLYTLNLTYVEPIAALSRKVRTTEISPADARNAESAFMVEWQQLYQIIEVTTDLIERAALLARRYPLRGYDAVHLAAALTIDGQLGRAGSDRVTLISADQDQLQAAASEGMLIDGPNSHP